MTEPPDCSRYPNPYSVMHHGELLLKPIRFEAKIQVSFLPRKPLHFCFFVLPLTQKCWPAIIKQQLLLSLSSSQLAGRHLQYFFFCLCPFPRILRAACSHLFLPKSQWLVTQRQFEKLIIYENSARWMCKIKWNLSNPTVFARWTENPHFWQSQSDLTCCKNSNIVFWLLCRVRVWLIFSTRSEWFWYLYF